MIKNAVAVTKLPKFMGARSGQNGYLFVIVHDLILYDAKISFSVPKIVFLTMELILPIFN